VDALACIGGALDGQLEGQSGRELRDANEGVGISIRLAFEFSLFEQSILIFNVRDRSQPGAAHTRLNNDSAFTPFKWHLHTPYLQYRPPLDSPDTLPDLLASPVIFAPPNSLEVWVKASVWGWGC
jgi:hypothetical protein